MTRPEKPQAGPVGRILVTAAIVWALVRYPPQPWSDGAHHALWWFGVLVAVIGAAKSLPPVGRAIADFLRFLRATGRDASRGSAAWLSEREARKAGLFRRRKGAAFGGVLGAHVVWLWTETHSLVIGPAGSAKSTADIVPRLCSIDEPCLVSDTKGELREATAALRARRFGHRIVALDPTDPESECVNPLDPAREMVLAGSPEALSYVDALTMQLYPEPTSGSDQNRFFRAGTRLGLKTVMLCAVAVYPPEMCNLPTVHLIFTDRDRLHDLLVKAAAANLLGGAIAALAEDLHQTVFGEDGAAKTYEQFRLGAMEALQPYAVGGYLQRITSKTTFSFRSLKTERVTVFLIVNFRHKETFGQWSGLMQFVAAYELVSFNDNRPVHFILDEFCNAPLHNLPSLLTLLRSYGIRVTMATQDLDDVTRVYGKHALETILSEADIKKFLGGIRSRSTLEFLSKYLGEFTETASSFSLGERDVQESLARHNRRLLTEDEIRRLAKDRQIVLFGNLKPMLLRKTQVFAISPWRRWIAPAAAYGGRRKLLPVEVKLGWFGATVTRRGRADPPRRGRSGRVLGYLLARLPLASLVLLAGLAAAVWSWGLPHLRWEYAYRGPAHPPASYVWCRYAGPYPVTLHGPDCPIVIFRKTW